MDGNDINEVIHSLIPLISIEAKKLLEKEKRKRQRKVWVKERILKRPRYGASNVLLKELASEDPAGYKNILRMNCEKFEELLQLVETKIQRKNTVMRMAIPARTKLEATLRYLATGDSFASIMYLFHLPKCTTSNFLPEVLSAIYEVLQPYIKIPKNEKTWIEVQNVFEKQWNFPDCCGSLDGKHIQIICPKDSGSDFHNYKGTYSTVLFALVDGDYCFRYIDVGANGRASDAAIFNMSKLNKAMMKNTLKMPSHSVFIGDDAFPLRPNLLKPYSRRKMTPTERIFNYRLSRARRVVENAFGILAARFRIFLRPIDLKDLGTVDAVVQASCALHNWLRLTSRNSYFSRGSVDVEDLDTEEIIPGSWRAQIPAPLASVRKFKGDDNRKLAELRRGALSKYFVGEGAVPWQWRAVGISSVDSCISVAETDISDEESDPDDPDIPDDCDEDETESSEDEGSTGDEI